jgi:hypothetical protein
MSLGYVSGLRNNSLHEIKMFTQRCKTVILYNGSAFKFPTQFLRRITNWRGTSTVTYHCIWTIISVGVILCDKRMLLEKGLPYTLKSPNKQLMHTFLHFAVSLQRRFYQFRTVFVFNVYIYSSSSRLFKIDPLVSLQPATHRQSFMLALSLPLRWLRVTFVLNTTIALNELFFMPVT